MNIMYKFQKPWVVIAGAFLFNAIFWQEKLGLNAVLFDAFIVSAVLYMYPKAKADHHVKWLLLLQSITLVMVLIHNSLLSKIAWMIVMLLFISFSEYRHRSVWYAGGSMIQNTVSVFRTFSQYLIHIKRPAKSRTLARFLFLSLIPLCLSLLFFNIYVSSNSVFLTFANTISAQIRRFLALVFGWFSIQRLLFLAFGFYTTAWLVVRSTRNYFGDKDLQQKDMLERKNKLVRLANGKYKRKTGSLFPGKYVTGMIVLKIENLTGIISLLLLNMLLLAVNTFDVLYIWLNFTFTKNVNLSAAVHEGTGLLILSIILAMIILLFLFKGNLNFYRNNKWLKLLAFVWIFQNCILVVSVAIRDYYYIAHFGLAYKRIGVLFFLVSVLSGLITVYIKINFKKTGYYLFRINAWVNILLLVFAATIQWDEVITLYNIKKADVIWVDWDFLLNLSDKTLPALEENKKLLQKADQSYVRAHDENDGFINLLREREETFLKEQKNYSWLSWNFSDHSVEKYLLHHSTAQIKK